jgi:hypothetical protein
MFEAGKKYQRSVITKKRQEDIAYYECVHVGEFNTLFKVYSLEGKPFNEILVPNDNFPRFEIFSDDKHRIEHLNKSIDKIEKELREIRIKKIMNIAEEIKLINNIKILKTKIDGKERTLLTHEEAMNFHYNYPNNIMD